MLDRRGEQSSETEDETPMEMLKEVLGMEPH
jgi:hypothetical protein